VSYSDVSNTSQDFPGSNETVVDWGVNWITQHAKFAKRANKPVVLEEFGLTGLRWAIPYAISLLVAHLFIVNQTTGYQKWVERKCCGCSEWSILFSIGI
jgi:hypothetical protein